MNKIIWIFIAGIVIIAGIYFIIVKNKNNPQFTPNNTEEIPQPPQLPE